jgi:hypothetical protein
MAAPVAATPEMFRLLGVAAGDVVSGVAGAAVPVFIATVEGAAAVVSLEFVPGDVLEVGSDAVVVVAVVCAGGVSDPAPSPPQAATKRLEAMMASLNDDDFLTLFIVKRAQAKFMYYFREQWRLVKVY